MSKFFNEVDFPLDVDPGENKNTKPKYGFNEEKLKEAVGAIKKEFEKIRRGTSDLTPYAIDPGDFGFPAGNRLSLLLSEPTDDNFTGFIEIAKQDLGAKAAKRFMDLLKEAREEKANV